ncbi:MAG: PilW family protein [Acidobacteriota bacterium]|nr:PilW family protein [Acidobacteriota bacterium]
MRHRRSGERGFTLIEVIVTTVVLAVVMVGLYVLLDSSNKLAKQETNVAEAQQSVRIGIYELSRVIRQGRVGGLFIANAVLPIGNNVAGGGSLRDIANNEHFIRAGTDVIGVRGILSGDKYALTTGDVTCAGSCATTTAMTITIRSTSTNGVSNYTPGEMPSLSAKTRDFYFVVADGSTEVVTTATGSFLVPVYYVGLVDTAGTWYTQTGTPATTFSFVMDPQDTGARKLYSAAPTATTLDKPFSGGVVDEVRFFVDEGATDGSSSTADTHPALAEATFDPSSGNWDIQPLVQEVEDFQVAYGVDGADGTAKDRGVAPSTINVTGAHLDEWVGNVDNEIETRLPLTVTDPKRVDAFIDASKPSGPTSPIATVATLRSVMVSLVVKSSDPDFKYDGPGARGMKVLDSTARPFSAAASTGRPYRRRLQSIAVSLRNYQ